MGILTNKDSARSFSTYVAVFGLALLITSAIYLKDLNKWEETHTCVQDYSAGKDKFSGETLCSNYYAWRRAAVIGIVIGVFDVLLVPFLLCCGCCLVCGCTAIFCACLNCQSENSSSATNPKPENSTETQPTLQTNDTELAPATTTVATTSSDEDTSDLFGKFNLPKPILTVLNVVGWAVWVLLPFIGTLLMVIWISDKEAIRTPDDTLYNSALTVYVVAVLNLMVYFQKFIDSLFDACSKKEKEKKGGDQIEV